MSGARRSVMSEPPRSISVSSPWRVRSLPGPAVPGELVVQLGHGCAPGGAVVRPTPCCHLMPGAPDRMGQAIDRALSGSPDCPGIAQGMRQGADSGRFHFTKL